MQEVEFHLIETNGIRLHTVVAGPEDGELVVLLHGFPEFSYGFHHQMEALAASGYRVVAIRHGLQSSSEVERFVAVDRVVLDLDLPMAVDVLCDMVSDARLDESDVELLYASRREAREADPAGADASTSRAKPR